jgi:hypothetical protein
LLVLARVHEPARAMYLGRYIRSSKIFFSKRKDFINSQSFTFTTDYIELIQ